MLISKRIFILIATFLCATANADGISDYDCLIEPNMVVDINSSVQGKIEKILVQRSDLVEAGQLLVELESEIEKATVALAIARTEMDAELKERRVSNSFAKRKLVRFDGMFRDDVVPLHTKDEVATEARLAALQLKRSEEDRLVANLELVRAQAFLDQRYVKSPISGVIVERFKSPGEFVEDEPILRLAQLDPLKVEVILPASMFGRVKSGQKARIRPEAPMNGIYEAEVTIVDRVIDASSGTFSVRLQLPNPDHKLPGGLKCGVKFLNKFNKHQSEQERKGLVLNQKSSGYIP
ncbi:MAG: efflux RND transporter periplasmic adaptor subunit [Gammaproteobacteria bacterium]|nr:efflux RND transporter periplasmic adaptor subunit [Gammaproteobacteria bacterium]